MLETFPTIFEVVVSHWDLVLLFFIISVCYSAVGFGGGSSYLAVLALTTLPFITTRAIALLCNIVVVSGSSFVFIQKNILPWKKVLWLVAFSVPFAFLGGYVIIGQSFFYVLLGLTLVFAALTMYMSKHIVASETPLKTSKVKAGLMGGSIGFLSGMVGIGGGIFLAPLLHLTQWDSPKRIAATASFFILVNSIAGLAGQALSADFQFDVGLAIVLMTTVLIGGQLGVRWSSAKFSPVLLKKLTAVLIFFVGCKILVEYLLKK